MLSRSFLILAGFLLIAADVHAASSHPMAPTVNHWSLPELVHYPRLRVLGGRPVDVLFELYREGNDWRWDIEGRTLDPIAPRSVYSKEGRSSERYSVSSVGGPRISVYNYATGEFSLTEEYDVQGPPDIYDGTVVWPQWNGVAVFDVESQEMFSVPIVGGRSDSASIWGHYIAYNSAKFGGLDPDSVFIRNLVTGSTRQVFEGIRAGRVHASQGRVGFSGTTDLSPSLYAEWLGVPGSRVRVNTPDECGGLGDVRVAGAAANLLVYSAGCNSGRVHLYVTVIDSNSVYFVSELEGGHYQFDAQGASVAYVGADRKLHVITLDEGRM